jgi:hypothetical protein
MALHPGEIARDVNLRMSRHGQIRLDQNPSRAIERRAE